jgi:hypothetical protein
VENGGQVKGHFVTEDDSQVIERHNIPIHGTGAVAVEVLTDGVSVAVQDVDGGIICSLVVGLDEIRGNPSQRAEESDYPYLVSVAVGEVMAAWKEYDATGQKFSAVEFPKLLGLISSVKTLAELLDESPEEIGEQVETQLQSQAQTQDQVKQ